MGRLMSHQVEWSFDHRPIALSRMRIRKQDMPITLKGVRVVAPLWHVVVPGSGVLLNRSATDNNVLGPKIDNDRIELKYPRERKVVEEPCILLGGHYNYYHHLMDYMCSLYLVEDTFKQGGRKLLTLEPTQRFQKEIFEYLGIGEAATVTLPMFSAAECADVMVFPRIFHKWGLAEDPGIHEWIRKRFVRDAVAAPERRIYISRDRAKIRRLANEQALVPMIEDHGFEIVSLEDYTFAEQVKLFSEAKVIMAPHGAGLTNMVFANEGATIIELAPSDRKNNKSFFENLSAGASHQYHYVAARRGNVGWDAPEFSIHERSLREALGVAGVGSAKKHFRMGELSMDSPAPRVVYDIGMHNGDDTDYYLKKGFRVVAVEANPLLCEAAKTRFADHIASGRLQIHNVAIAAEAGTVRFFVNDSESVLSSLRKPADMTGWRKVQCQAVPLTSIIEAPDQIEFMKLDIEGADILALEDLYRSRIVPPNLSCEAHTVEVVCKLVSMGYRQFKIVKCAAIGKKDKPINITTSDGSVVSHRFLPHSSGPYGADLAGRWMNARQVLYAWLGRNILYGGDEWYDVHATMSV